MSLILRISTIWEQGHRRSISPSNMFNLRLPTMVLLFYLFTPFRIHCAVESMSVTFITHFCQPVLEQTARVLHQSDHWSLSNSFISFEIKNGSKELHFSKVNDVGGSSFTVYSPNTQADFIQILKSIAKNLAYDENDLPNAAAREAHIVCLPHSSSGSSPSFDPRNGFLRSQQLDGVYLPFNGAVYVARLLHRGKDTSSVPSELELIEVYSLGDHFMSKSVFVSVPHGGGLLDTTKLLQTSLSRQNLQGFPIKMVSQKEAGYEVSFDMDVIDGKTVFTGGTQYRMSLDYQEMLNFTYVPVWGTGWPRQLTRNGTRLNGMGQQLMDKEADMITISITFTAMRAEKFHFLPAVAYAESGVFYRGESAQFSPRGLLLRPFSEELWGATVAAFIVILVTTVSIAHSIHLAEKFGGGLNKRREQASCIWTTGVLLCQGGCLSLSEPPRRIVVLTAAFTSALLYSAYTGAFVASVSSPPGSLQSPDSLTKQGFTIFSSPDFTAYSEDFIQDPCELEQIVRNSKSLNVYNLEEMVRKVLDAKQRFAAIYRADGFYGTALSMNITKKEFCEISAIPAPRESRAPESFAVRKGWPFRELFTQQTVLLTERGLSQHYWDAYVKETKPPCVRTWKYQNVISLEECVGAFGALVAGIFMATVALTAEVVYNRKLSLDLCRKST